MKGRQLEVVLLVVLSNFYMMSLQTVDQHFRPNRYVRTDKAARARAESG
jgi:hypothetical protein